MQQDFAQLTIAAVETVFGPLTASVYSILALHGRQSLRSLVKQARAVSLRQVKLSLIVLVQHHLVFYDNDDTGNVHYTANGTSAYNAAFRFGKYAEIIEKRFGPVALALFQQLSVQGQSTLPNLIDECLKRSPNIIRAEALESVHALLKHGYLCQVTYHHFQPEHSLLEEVEGLVESRYGGPPKGKDAKLQAISDRGKIRQSLRDEAFCCHGADEGPPNKRRKLTQSGSTNGTKDFVFDGDPGTTVMINYEKCTVLLRNQQLLCLAHRCAGDAAAKVFEAVLSSLESRLMRCYDECNDRVSLFSKQESEPAVSSSTSVIMTCLGSPEIGHASGIVSVDQRNGQSDTLKRRPRDSSQIGPDLLPQLRLLGRIPPVFVTVSGSFDEWSIPFKHLSRMLIQRQIEDAIGSRFGPTSCRVVRILHAKYSADERFLAHASILKSKEIRNIVNALVSANLVHVQEVPRDANRTTNRLLWLYTYDPTIARVSLITDAYRAMFRLLKRLQTERKKRQLVIDKSERSDIKGKEAELLSEEERSQLDHFLQTEKAILAHLGRIDDMVACLRDFAPLDDPYTGNRPGPYDAEHSAHNGLQYDGG